MDEKRYALIIASWEYAGAGLSQLIAPPQDAQALAQVLGNPEIGGFEVRTLLNESVPNVRREIDALFKRHKDDLALLYFSGHGVKDTDGTLYLAMADTQLDLLYSTAIQSHDVHNLIGKSSARQKVLVLDCCYSGAFPRGLTRRSAESINTRQYFDGKGYAVLTASDAMQYAFEEDKPVEGEGVHSIFTRSLVRGLETGEADLNNDGMITTQELYDYAYNHVLEKTPDQKPNYWIGVEGKIVIAWNSRPVEPVPLPYEIVYDLNSPFPTTRANVIPEIERWLNGPRRGQARAAYEELKRIAKEDDSLQVRNAAAEALVRYEEAQRPKEPKRGIEQEHLTHEQIDTKNLIAEEPQAEALTEEKPEDAPIGGDSVSPGKLIQAEENKDGSQGIGQEQPIQELPDVEGPEAGTSGQVQEEASQQKPALPIFRWVSTHLIEPVTSRALLGLAGISRQAAVARSFISGTASLGRTKLAELTNSLSKAQRVVLLIVIVMVVIAMLVSIFLVYYTNPTPTATITFNTPSPTLTLNKTSTATKITLTPTKPPPPASTTPASTVPSTLPTPTPAGAIYHTDFNDLKDWTTQFAIPETDSFTATVQEGKLVIQIDAHDTTVYAFYDHPLDQVDVRIEADVEMVAGPNRNNISVICRASGDGWYEFSMNSGGSWVIWRYDYDANGYTALREGYSFAISTQKAKNRLTAVCRKDTMKFFINDREVGSVTDGTFAGGQIGVSLTTFDIEGAGAMFDRLTVYNP